jgi:tetratricopeptide (TPR) repeat protein
MVKVMAATVAPVGQVVPGLDPAVENLVERLLVKEPQARPTVDVLLPELVAWLQPWRANGRNLVAEALADPRGTAQRVAAAEAHALFSEAKALLAKGPGEKRRAAMLLYRASMLLPGDPELSGTFQSLCAEEKLSPGAAKNPKIRELEASLAEHPDAPGVLQQLANLYKLEGNVFQAAAYLKQYVRLKPNDGYAIGQLQQLTGTFTPLVPASSAPTRARPEPSAVAKKAAPEEDTFREFGPGGEPSNALVELLRAHGRLIGAVVSMALVLVFALRWTSRFIERSSGEQLKEHEAMLAPPKPSEPADPFSRRIATAQTAIGTGRPSEAVSLMDELIVSEPSHARLGEAYLVRGEAQLKLGHAPNAQSDLGEALSRLPPDAEALRRRAQLLLTQAQGSRPTSTFQSPEPPRPRPPPVPRTPSGGGNDPYAPLPDTIPLE